jgi:ABC-type amino acid transport substrate-binding protein
MNTQIISARAYGEGRLTLQPGSAVTYTMDDVLLTGTRSLSAKPSGWVIVCGLQSSKTLEFMLRNDDRKFKKLVDDAMCQAMKSADIKTLYDKWRPKPVPSKHPL